MATHIEPLCRIYVVFAGTTLVQEMVYLITTGDWKRAREVQLDERFPIIEVLDERFPFYGGIKMVEKLPRPRLIKSHLHQFLLPEKLRRGKGKVLYSYSTISKVDRICVCLCFVMHYFVVILVLQSS